ncbi:MAG: hypothetical protein V3574_00105 [Candidatus Moraniibacteriota bacterium]
MYWIGSDGTVIGNGTGTGSTTLGSRLDNGEWHKIEIYMKLGTSYLEQSIHLQIDDYDVYQDAGEGVNFLLPASLYIDCTQFASIRATNRPPFERGYYYFDDVTIVYNEGDLCDNEPIEPVSIDLIPPLSPTGLGVL